jgi:hypothetical protein
VGRLVKYNYEDIGCMEKTNMNMQLSCGRAWEMQLRGGKEAWERPF